MIAEIPDSSEVLIVEPKHQKKKKRENSIGKITKLENQSKRPNIRMLGVLQRTEKGGKEIFKNQENFKGLEF